MSLRHSCFRHLCQRKQFTPLLVVLLLLTALPVPARSPQQETSQPNTSGKRIWLRDAQPIAVNHVGSAKSIQAIASAQPLALAKGDFDADGVDDLVVGYASANGGVLAFHRGNLDAFAPQSEESFQAIGRGDFPPPFLPTAVLVDVPVRPDFVAVGSYNGEGYPDVIVAQRSDSSIYLLGNNGKGVFSDPKKINVGGPITALASGDLGSHAIYSKLLVGISDHTGSHLMVYTGTLNGLGGVKVLPLNGAAASIQFGDFGDTLPDAAVLAGDQIEILRSPTMDLAQVSLPVMARAFAFGSFIPDRNPGPQIAVLDANGNTYIVAHDEFDPRIPTRYELNAIHRAVPRGRANSLMPKKSFPVNGWKIVETVSGIAPSAGPTPVLLSTRISDHGADDVMVLNALTGQMTLIAHPDSPAGATAFAPAEISYRPYSGSPTAAISMRVNVDSRPGIVAIHLGQTAPSVMMPLPDPTFFTNEFDDPTPPSDLTTVCTGTSNTDTATPCSLREAILKANATAGTDTVMLAAGTYTLTIARVSGDFSGRFGTLEVTDSVNIIGTVDGSGNPSSIVQACDPSPNPTCSTGVDKVFSFNQDITAFTNANVSISNVVIRFGHNRGAFGGLQDGFGGGFDFDTGGTTAGTGNATLVVTNCTIIDNTTTDGDGGGAAIFNTNSGTGFAHFVNSTIQSNSPTRATSGAAGGGIFVGSPARIVLDNTKVINNTATQTSPATGNGGGIFTFGQPDPSVESAIHASTISGNQAAGDGGGLDLDATITIDTGTVISNNQAGTAGGGATNGGNGGGILFSSQTGDSLTISKTTLTGNSAVGGAGATPGGGGIWFGANRQTLNMHFSRLSGNTAPNGHNLDIPVVGTGSALSATNNWWGTNAPGGTITQGTANSVVFDPFIVLTHTASPSTIKINQSSTLTGDMSKDNHGNGAALSGNLDEIVGLPITFDSPVLGTIPQAQPETLGSPVPTATATFNAGGTAGFGTANATVDQAAVPVNSNLIASATESGTTATITTVGAHGFTTGQFVKIVGVGVSGYNSASGQFFTVGSTPSANTFTYTADTSGLGASSGGTVNGGIIILEPPSITKSFNPTTAPTNTPSTVTFSITNGNVVPIDASFTDSLPANLVVATTPTVVNTNCGGTVTATAGSTSISFSDSALPAGTCSIQVNVQSAVDNTYANSITIDSTDAGNGNTSSANLTVINPPSITKTFGAATIPLNGTTSLTFTISSTNQNLTLSGVAFTDNLPAGLVVATPNGLTTTCSGTASATAGSGSVSLSGASLAPAASCTVSANVTGTTVGVKNNSVEVTSTNGGTGNTSNASLTVVGPPTITKAFGAAGIPLNGSTSLSFTINNPNTTVALSGVAFSDTLPAGLIVSTPNGLTGSCGSGTITASQNTGTVSLSGGTITANNSCTLSVNVTGTVAGTQSNTTGVVTSTEGGTGATSNTAVVTVVAPPSIAKAFNPSTIALNATTSLTFTITNPTVNPVPLAGVAFTDTLPTGLTVASGTSTTCGGTLTTTAPTGITLSAATIASGGQCQFSVTVNGAASGQYTNTSGNVTSTNGGTGNTASANLTVAAPASITKTFGAPTIPLNGTTSLSFSISNPNTSLGLTGVSFIDSLPAGLVVATPNGESGTCGSGTITAVAGSGAVSLSGGTIASGGSCAFSVNVLGTTAGSKSNGVTVNSTEGGTGNTSLASLVVVAPATLVQAFGATSVALNGTTTLTATVNNPNSVPLTGLTFQSISAGNSVSGPASSNSCGGVLLPSTGTSGGLSISGGGVAANSTCSFSFGVTGTAAGTASSTVNTVTTMEGGSGTGSTATMFVVAPPAISKAFVPSSITVNGTTSLSFTISNPSANTTSELGVAFSDVLPSGLVVGTPNNLTNSCGGTPTATAGSTSISLTGGSIATGSSCQVGVNVTSSTSGSFSNTSGNVSSTNGGTGNFATAGLTVASPPSMTKAFGSSTIPLNGTTSMTFNITNPNSGLALSGVQFTDTLPSGLVVSSATATNTCGGSATAGSGGLSFSLSGGSIPAGGSCSVSTTVQGTTAGAKTNSTTVSSSNAGAGNTPSANITVVAPPVASMSFGAGSIPVGGTTSLTFEITNPNSLLGLDGININDLVQALITFQPNSISGSCGGGTITVSANSISLANGSLAAGGSCKFSANVTGVSAGTVSNTASAVTSTEGGTGNAATASLFVVAPPVIAKAFTPSQITLNGTTSLGFTITNPSANTVDLTGVAFTDTLPAGLTMANGTGTACGGTLSVTGGNTISLSGATVPVGTQCTPSVTVTGAAPGLFTNVTGNVSSTNGGTGNTAMAKLQVGDFSLKLSPNTETVPPGHMGVYTLTITSTGFTGPVSFTCGGGPAGSKCTVLPSTVNITSANTTATLTLDFAVPKGASKGTFTIDVIGIGGGLTHTATATLKVGLNQ